MIENVLHTCCEYVYSCKWLYWYSFWSLHWLCFLTWAHFLFRKSQVNASLPNLSDKSFWSIFMQHDDIFYAAWWYLVAASSCGFQFICVSTKFCLIHEYLCISAPVEMLHTTRLKLVFCTNWCTRSFTIRKLS